MEKTLQRSEREPLYDVIKGISIIAIVLGHCPPSVAVCNFVYAFHLAIFVFVSGMQINSEKYSHQPWALFTSRLRSMWPAYFGYMTFFTLSSNFFAQHRFLPWNAYRETSELLPRIFKNFVFLGSEAFAGAMWFVPMLLMTVALFAIVLHLSYGRIKKYPLIIAGALSLIMGALGVMTNLRKVDLVMHAQTPLLLFPILFAGYLLSHLKVDKNKMFHTLGALPCLFVLWFFIIRPGRRIDLAANLIGEPLSFYLITVCGIYLICVAAKWLCKLSWTRWLFSFLGKYSFDIMAMHFFMFKLVDRIWEFLWPNPDVPVTLFPCVNTARWPLYLLLSLALPPLIRVVLNKSIHWAETILENH